MATPSDETFYHEENVKSKARFSISAAFRKVLQEQLRSRGEVTYGTQSALQRMELQQLAILGDQSALQRMELQQLAILGDQSALQRMELQQLAIL
ncbi:hypothetical protein SKAU_G00308490 [Synaphobranchus kaupii]|uniref:Uncharacterized protein n=1 Tax=Synaphobranchus kaupii TaxID=118154 RepID=A0A9Q1ER75_SYNKA|nr:hypothetical protein SKAU_G00308490 [Synaphobranchus kaupii]